MFLCSADDMSSGRGADDMSSGSGVDDTSLEGVMTNPWTVLETDVWMTLALSVRKEDIKEDNMRIIRICSDNMQMTFDICR